MVKVKDLEELGPGEEVRQLLWWWWWLVRCHSTLDDRGEMLDEKEKSQFKLTDIKILNQIDIILFLHIDRVQAERLSNLGLDVVEGHLLDLRDGEDGLLGGLVEGRHPAQTALVSSDLSHAEVHNGVDEAVIVKLQLLQQEVLDVGLAHLGQLCLSAPLVVDERQLDTVRLS